MCHWTFRSTSQDLHETDVFIYIGFWDQCQPHISLTHACFHNISIWTHAKRTRTFKVKTLQIIFKWHNSTRILLTSTFTWGNSLMDRASLTFGISCAATVTMADTMKVSFHTQRWHPLSRPYRHQSVKSPIYTHSFWVTIAFFGYISQLSSGPALPSLQPTHHTQPVTRRVNDWNKGKPVIKRDSDLISHSIVNNLHSDFLWESQ